MYRIAVIEDQPDNLDIVCLMLNDVYRVCSFPDGATFIEDFVPDYFALVILDLIMPGLDGYEVYRRIRQQDATVPVVALTGSVFAEKGDRVRLPPQA